MEAFARSCRELLPLLQVPPRDGASATLQPRRQLRPRGPPCQAPGSPPSPTPLGWGRARRAWGRALARPTLGRAGTQRASEQARAVVAAVLMRDVASTLRNPPGIALATPPSGGTPTRCLLPANAAGLSPPRPDTWRHRESCARFHLNTGAHRGDDPHCAWNRARREYASPPPCGPSPSPSPPRPPAG